MLLLDSPELLEHTPTKMGLINTRGSHLTHPYKEVYGTAGMVRGLLRSTALAGRGPNTITQYFVATLWGCLH